MSSPDSITRDDEMKFRLFIETVIIEINSNWMSGKKIFKERKQDWIKFTYQIKEHHNQLEGNRELNLDLNGITKRYIGNFKGNNIKSLIPKLLDIQL